MNNIDNAKALANIKFPPLLQGLLAAAIVALFGSVLLSAVFCYTNLTDSTTHALQLPLLGLSALAGGLVAAKKYGRKGLVQGIKVAAILMAILLLATLATGSPTPAAIIIKGVIIFAGGAIGGILGVL